MKLFELQDRPEQEKNFDRNVMPQIRKDDLQNSPFEFKKGKIRLDKLKPVQSQRVKGMHDRAKQGFTDGSIRPIVIDKNNYIVNGHHRYDVARGLELKKVRVLKVDATIEDLIDHFTDTASDEPTYEQIMKAKLDSLMETIEASQDISALMKGIEADLKQRKKDLKRLPKKSIYSEGGVSQLKPQTSGTKKPTFSPQRSQKAYEEWLNGAAVDTDIEIVGNDNQLYYIRQNTDGDSQHFKEDYWYLTDAEYNPVDFEGYEDPGDLLFSHSATGYEPIDPDQMDENFADGKKKGKSKPGRVKKAGASCKGSVTDLKAKAKKYSGEKGKMYQWCANMKGGKKKANEELANKLKLTIKANAISESLMMTEVDRVKDINDILSVEFPVNNYKLQMKAFVALPVPEMLDAFKDLHARYGAKSDAREIVRHFAKSRMPKEQLTKINLGV